MSEWNFMDPASRGNVMTVWRDEAERFFDVAENSDWEGQTACELWQTRDVVGHLVDTTEGYFTSFDAARGRAEASDAIGLADMARLVNEGARSFRDVPKGELLSRLRKDLDRMLEIADGISDDEWTGLLVPHKYMGPLPACIYPAFQIIDYTVHGWDIPQGAGRGMGLAGDSADILVPLSFIFWQSTAAVPAGTEPYSLGIRITSGRNAGDTRASVSTDGVTFEPGDVDDLPAMIEFDPASFTLTVTGRVNGGTTRGDTDLADRFRNLYFRI